MTTIAPKDNIHPTELVSAPNARTTVHLAETGTSAKNANQAIIWWEPTTLV